MGAVMAGEFNFVNLRRARLKDPSNHVGSFYPLGENFRLTPEVKAKFTKKLASIRREFFGRKVQDVVRLDGLKLVFDDGPCVYYRVSERSRWVGPIPKRAMKLGWKN
jgi:hypothetical protein